MIEAIIKTICYFDLLDYPLTATEIWRWYYAPPSAATRVPTLPEVVSALEQDQRLQSLLTRREGFYCLKGREHSIAQRKFRNSAVDKQMKIAFFWTRIFRLVPWVRMVAVASSLPLGNVKEKSDIDFFIVCSEHHVWITRFLLVGLLKLSRQRPVAEHTRNKICLSYYVTTQALALQSARLSSDDIVFTNYVAGFLPLYDAGGVYKAWYDANSWYRHTLPNMGPQGTALADQIPWWLPFWHQMFNILIWPLYNPLTRDWYTRIQLQILPERLKSLANIDGRVIITENVLKFHDKDNRLPMRSQWQTNIKKIFHAQKASS
jgi:hypothetical protein